MKKILLFTACIFSLCITSCHKAQKKTFVPSENTIQLEVDEAPVSKDMPSVRWTGEDGTIVVLLGYGFNTQEFISTGLSSLIEKYGLYENGGILKVVHYPEDFKHGTTTRISDLNNYLNDSNLKGIILLGAPEGIGIPLSKQHDLWENNLPYSVFSFFPQEDILAMEANADFILEAERKTEDNVLEQVNLEIDPSVYPVFDFAIRYMLELPAPLPLTNDLLAHVQQIVGKEYTVQRYIDSETNLPSINHFIMERK